MGAIDRGHVRQPETDLGAAKSRCVDSFRTENAISDATDITRSEKERRRAALNEVLRKRGANLDAAAAWNVSETRVRQLRRGVGVLTDKKIEKLPDDLRGPLLALLGAPALSPSPSNESDTHGPFQEAA